MIGKKGNLVLTDDDMKKVGAVVLGGGRGTRLYPLTKERAKPAVPLCGRYRLIDIPMSNCIHSGIKRIVILTQFNSHSLNRHINLTYKFDDFTKGYVEVLSAEQTDTAGTDWFQGTADAVRKQLRHIQDQRVDHYMILSGDQLYRMDFRTLMGTHLSKDADITVSALPVTREAAEGFGVMRMHKNGRIREFVEKPTDDEVLRKFVTPPEIFGGYGLAADPQKPYLASMGIYAFKAKVLEGLLVEHPEWDDFGGELIPNALRTHRVFAHMFSGFWADIGTVRSYFDVSMALTTANPPFEFHDQRHLFYTHARALPGAKILDAKVKNAIICAGARINQSVITDTIVGIRAIVQSGAEISRSIILGAEYFDDERRRANVIPVGIGRNTRIHQAIIDHNARIGKGVVIRGSKRLRDHETEDYVVRDGIVIVLKNGVIPDGTVIA